MKRYLGLVLVLLLVLPAPSWADRLFTCGFEENNLSSALLTTMWTSAGAGASITNSTPHSGTYAGQLAGNTGKNFSRSLQTSLTSGTVYVRFYWRADSFASTSRIFSDRSSGGSHGINVSVVTTGVVRLNNIVSGGAAVDSSATLSVNTQYRFEVEHIIADAGGAGDMTVSVYAGDSTTPVETLSIPAAEDTLPTSNVRDFFFEESAANIAITSRFDDIAINVSTGSAPTSWPGPGKIYMLVPNNEVSATWTPLSGTNNNLMVDDLPGEPADLGPDDDTTYNSSGTANDEDRLGLETLGAEVPSDATITLLDVYARVRGDSTAGTRQMRMLLWNEAGTQTNGPTTTLNDSTAYALMGTNDHLVVSGSGKTKNDIDSYDVGYEPLTASNTFVTAVWVNVEWTEAVAGGAEIFGFGKRRAGQ